MFTPPGAAARKVTQAEAVRAAQVLHVNLTGLPRDLVQRAFRTLVRNVHPDAGGDVAAAPERLKELTAARDTLLAWLAQAPKAECKECRGTGWVWGRFAVKPCSRCGR